MSVRSIATTVGEALVRVGQKSHDVAQAAVTDVNATRVPETIGLVVGSNSRGVREGLLTAFERAGVNPEHRASLADALTALLGSSTAVAGSAGARLLETSGHDGLLAGLATTLSRGVKGAGTGTVAGEVERGANAAAARIVE